MWLRALEFVTATGLVFVAVTIVLLAIRIIRTPHHEWEAERRKILEQKKRAKEFYSVFRDK